MRENVMRENVMREADEDSLVVLSRFTRHISRIAHHSQNLNTIPPDTSTLCCLSPNKLKLNFGVPE